MVVREEWCHQGWDGGRGRGSFTVLSMSVSVSPGACGIGMRKMAGTQSYSPGQSALLWSVCFPPIPRISPLCSPPFPRISPL